MDGKGYNALCPGSMEMRKEWVLEGLERHLLILRSIKPADPDSEEEVDGEIRRAEEELEKVRDNPDWLPVPVRFWLGERLPDAELPEPIGGGQWC
jgi:hypothetical protein